MTTSTRTAPSFGGPWTKDKLDVIEGYLTSYTTALKDQAFRLVYIDAFAGTGQIEVAVRDADEQGVLRGSAYRALAVRDRAFDRVILIEKSAAYCRELEKLRASHSKRDVGILNADANSALVDLRMEWRQWRGVVFLDPFATQLDWKTVQAIADTEALDTWILFPVGAIRRLLPRRKRPE